MNRLWTQFRTWWTRPGPRKWRGVALVVPFMVLIAVGIGYTNYVQRQADQRWCELVELLNEQAELVPPETEIEQRFVDIIEELLEDLPC